MRVTVLNNLKPEAGVTSDGCCLLYTLTLVWSTDSATYAPSLEALAIEPLLYLVHKGTLVAHIGAQFVHL